MIDYSLKKQLLESGLVDLKRKYNKNLYKAFRDNKLNLFIELSSESSFMLEANRDNWLNAQKILNADSMRQYRLKSRITELLKSSCLFLTLTFSNDYLSKTDRATRRKAITRYLRQFNTEYVANIDFGSDNGREHYHAVIKIDNIDLSSYKYGFIFAEHINASKTNASGKIATYISKLTNHAIKETTKRNSIIYSR